MTAIRIELSVGALEMQVEDPDGNVLPVRVRPEVIPAAAKTPILGARATQ